MVGSASSRVAGRGAGTVRDAGLLFGADPGRTATLSRRISFATSKA
jgi:hypothetical protein